MRARCLILAGRCCVRETESRAAMKLLLSWTQVRLGRAAAFSLLAFAVAMVPGTRAQETVVTLDPAQTKVEITVDSTLHLVHGTFQLKRGTIHFDPATGKVIEYPFPHSEAMMRAVVRSLPDGTYRAEDFLDDDGISDTPLRIAVRIRIGGAHAVVDFTGSSPECAGSVNAVRAIAESAVFYVFRCLLNGQIPATSGLMRPIEVITPEGTIVNARPPRAVAGGNVETSQRIVDALLKALSRAAPEKIPAASQGTMNNLTFGGADDRPGRGGKPFAYYETIAGGMGARPDRDGVSGIHTHMTNSLNTPIEVLEHTLPIRVRQYSLRRNSGGKGKYRGGDGVIREFEALTEIEVCVLSDRRKRGPYGLAGGTPGKPGQNKLQSGPHMRQILAKGSIRAKKGDILRIETPGGGGWGKP